MAKLASGELILGIKPLYMWKPTADGWSSWKYYEFSITVVERSGKELPLFNPELCPNPFKDCSDTNSISTVFSEALETGKISHFAVLSEPNFNVAIYPQSYHVYLELPNASSTPDDMFLVIFQFDTNTFALDGYTGDGPACIMEVEKNELDKFTKALIEEEIAAFTNPRYKLS